MISTYPSNSKNRASKAILAVALILSLLSGFTTSKSSATTSKTQSEWVVREKGKLNLISAFNLSAAQSPTSFSYHSEFSHLLYQNRLVEVKFNVNQNQFLLMDLSILLFIPNIHPHVSDEDYLLV
ncbi:MAG: hypothetical protein IPK96_20065 [Flammeovirgaceae bacterium]|nr:hypothetical protein [Flammeovirgaceae bacterium]